MAYQAKRSKKYVEDFELVDAEGNIKHVGEKQMEFTIVESRRKAKTFERDYQKIC